MQINSIQYYNQQAEICRVHKQQNPAFGNIKPDIDVKRVFREPELARPFTEQVKKLQSETFNLREIVDISKLTETGKKVLKEFFNTIGEKEIQDFTINLEMYHWRFDADYYAQFSRDILSDKESFCCSPSSRKEEGNPIKFKTGWYGGEQAAYLPTDVNYIKTQLNKQIIEICNKRGEEIEKQAAEERKEQEFDELQEFMNTEPEKLDIAKEIVIPADDLLPVASIVCTLDDINNYLLAHMYELGEGRIFNKPVTEDGESLLIALTHVLPDNDNIDRYISLVKSMQKMPFIDYNQKDTMNIPAIAHVLNSQNKLLFSAFCNCEDLKYDPSLEFEFSSITDSEFKDLVLGSRIFENEQNTEFKTMFGQPNPLYK